MVILFFSVTGTPCNYGDNGKPIKIQEFSKFPK